MFDCLKFLKDYNIQTKTKGANTAPGWVQIHCPMPGCKDKSYHGGFNIKSGYYNCWQCGKHHPIQVIQHLLQKTYTEALFIFKLYQTYISYSIEEEIKHAEKVIFPEGIGELGTMHRDYLKSRNFDPIALEKEFHLKGTGPIGNYKFRIIAPIFFNGRIVSYQGRDVTGIQPARYKACAKKDEVIEHKHTLYNIDNALKDTVIVVEGITDVWRLKEDSVALFGVKYTKMQLYLLAQKFSKAFILFDEEAEERAEELGNNLSGLSVKVNIIELEKGDPAELSDEEALYMKKQLIGG